jgi:hypothetical protein
VVFTSQSLEDAKVLLALFLVTQPGIQLVKLKVNFLVIGILFERLLENLHSSLWISGTCQTLPN